MAAPRRNRNHPNDPAFEKSRAKIRTTQLIKRLVNHALGTKDDQGNLVQLDNSQVTAIKILLGKTIPDLQAIELTGRGGGPVQTENLTDSDLDARIKTLQQED